MPSKIDLTGKRFGRVLILGLKERKNRHSYWFCKCDCGSEFVSIGNNLVRGKTKSCGCLRKELTGEKCRTHGDSYTKFFGIWCAMRKRALSPRSPRFKDYGGRGITVCERWLVYENFKADMYQLYLEHVQEFGEHNTTIERKNVDGNYCPENCIWETYQEQSKNTRRTVRLNYQDHTYTIKELAQKIDMNPYTFKDRIARGWNIEKAVLTPIKH